MDYKLSTVRVFVTDWDRALRFYTETLARAVGPLGRVLSHNSPLTHERYGRFLDERLDAARLGNIERRVEPIDALTLEPASLDAAFLILFYHDTYWMGVDRSAMNRAVLNALRPGGVYLVIDHAAEPGSGSRDNKTLHRIDEEMVRAEIQGAGFRLTRSAAFLRNPDDERTRNVFEPGIRGRTDRFVLRFEKP